MASVEYVVKATDLASDVFKKIALSADRLDHQLADLSKRVATPEVDLKDAAFTAGMISAAKRIDKLSAAMATPGVDLNDPKFQAEIIKINAQLDRLDKRHVTATVEVKAKTDRLSQLGGLLGLGGKGGGLGSLAGTAAGALGIGAAIGPLLVGLSQVTSALAAAGLGVGAFAALAIPQFVGVQKTLHQVAIDTNAYERATTKAAKSTALAKIKQDWADISPAQRHAAHGMQSLQAAFMKLSATLAPLTWKVFNVGLKIANDLMPALVPFARAAGNALDGLFLSLDKFIKTAGFKAFLAQLQALSGPAITALGVGLGKITISLGKLILVSASPNSIKVLSGLLTVLAGTIDVVTFVVGRASGKIVEWKNDFADIGRVVGGAIQAVTNWIANSHAFEHSLIHDIAGGFDIARHAAAAFGHWIASAFDAVRHVFAGIGHFIADTFDRVRHFQGQFGAFGKDIQLIGHWIVVAFDAIRHGGAIAFDALRHAIAASWNRIGHDTTAQMDNLRHGIAATWDVIWHHSQDQARSGIAGIVRWFQGLPGRVIHALFGLGHQLYAFGHAALNDFWSGMLSMSKSILGWIGHFVSMVWDKVKKFFGFGSPSRLFYEAGKNLMIGMEHGIQDHAHKAVAAAQAVSHRVASAGAGVQRWAGLVRRALAMEGLSPGLLGNVLFQMSTESGGNPNAINLNDINAQMGDPSRGLMQTIMSTFQAYHWPGTSNNIYDPLANIAAALNYARHVYGPSLMSGGMGIGSGKGYAAGSWNVPYTGPAVVHQGEMIIPAASAAAIRGGRGGAVLNIENYNAYTGTDEALLAQRLSFAVTAAGLGS